MSVCVFILPMTRKMKMSRVIKIIVKAADKNDHPL